jgi:hypothetical protein
MQWRCGASLAGELVSALEIQCRRSTVGREGISDPPFGLGSATNGELIFLSPGARSEIRRRKGSRTCFRCAPCWLEASRVVRPEFLQELEGAPCDSGLTRHFSPSRCGHRRDRCAALDRAPCMLRFACSLRRKTWPQMDGHRRRLVPQRSLNDPALNAASSKINGQCQAHRSSSDEQNVDEVAIGHKQLWTNAPSFAPPHAENIAMRPVCLHLRHQR